MPVATRKRAGTSEPDVIAGPSSVASVDECVASTSAAAGHPQGSKRGKVGFLPFLNGLIGYRGLCS